MKTKWIEKARKLDQNDPIAFTRQWFVHSPENLIYLDGNSLGRLPKGTADRLQQEIQEAWGTRLIRSWNEGWYTQTSVTGGKIAKLIGAKSDEVVVTDSTSQNLFKLAWAAVSARPGRKVIVSDTLNFPSDLYILQGIIYQLGPDYSLRLIQSQDGMTVSDEDIKKALSDDVALVVLSHVTFKSAFMYDMKKVTGWVHESGALMLWDLSHAAGAVLIDLNGSEADLAVGCTYKYLNGGPGSPAFLYVRKDLQDHLTPPVWGWFGDARPFDFQLTYKPSTGIRKFTVGTPPVLSLAAVDASVDLLVTTGMEKLRKKSLQQSEFLIEMWKEVLLPLGFTLGSPENPDQRGSHISFRHPEAYAICQALIAGVDGGPVIIPDFREPDHVRIGITPLYTTFEDLAVAVLKMSEIVNRQLHLSFQQRSGDVT
ncbi:MAG: kynureninase [Bacteroidetes bacterium]|nr:kynureninase [Bacteroidota bacterium]